MRRPVGVEVLGISFVVMGALIVLASNWYWVGQPADNMWHPVQAVAENVLGIFVGAIGLGLLVWSRAARWLAFLSLLLVVAGGMGALSWDVLSQRKVWIALDVFLIVALIAPAIYLLMPAVRDEFARHPPEP